MICDMIQSPTQMPAGFFYYISEVQPYDRGGWSYINELHRFVNGGMVGDDFINAVSGIVNRGCHNPVSLFYICKILWLIKILITACSHLLQPCGTGELDGGPERKKNFFDILKAMDFSFVDVVDPKPIPSPTSGSHGEFRHGHMNTSF